MIYADRADDGPGSRFDAWTLCRRVPSTGDDPWGFRPGSPPIVTRGHEPRRSVYGLARPGQGSLHPSEGVDSPMKDSLAPAQARVRKNRTGRNHSMGLKRTPRFLLLSLGYAAVLAGCFVLALLLRFEFVVPDRYWQGAFSSLPWFVGFSLLGFFVAGLYHGLWRYASTVTLFQVFKGATLSAAVLV